MPDLRSDIEGLRKVPREYHYMCWGGSTVTAIDEWSDKPDMDCRRAGSNDWPRCKACDGKLHHDEPELKDYLQVYNRAIDDVLALLAAHGPDLRERVLANYTEVSREYALTYDPPTLQVAGGKCYVPKWGCDTLDHVLDAIAGHTEAGEWRGEYICSVCHKQFGRPLGISMIFYRSEHYLPDGKQCTGKLVPYERRKGAER